MLQLCADKFVNNTNFLDGSASWTPEGALRQAPKLLPLEDTSPSSRAPGTVPLSKTFDPPQSFSRQSTLSLIAG